MKIDERYLKGIVRAALDEDIGKGDVTSRYVIPEKSSADAVIIAKSDGVLCGIGVAEEVFKHLDKGIIFRKKAEDGKRMKKGQILAEVSGKTRALLAGERTALNFLQRLSGIATKTSLFSRKIRGCGVSLLDTRKTTPGLRLLEKYAVKCGGGKNHRMGLFDGILIKDNHIAVAGLRNAIKNAKKSGMKVEAETKNLGEVRTALDAGADIIMLDNMDIEDIKKAVRLVGKRALVEVSGGVNMGNIEKIAKLGVDWISVGGLTHSAEALDISMEIVGHSG